MSNPNDNRSVHEQMSDSAPHGNESELVELKKQLSSGLCSAHQEPDPLHCPECNMVKWLQRANESRYYQCAELLMANKELLNVLAGWSTSMRLAGVSAVKDSNDPIQAILFRTREALSHS